MPKLLTGKVFTGINDFEAYNNATKFLDEAGFSIGHMCREQPIGILFGDVEIAKWKNLTPRDISLLDGVITAPSFRHGPVTVELWESAEDEAKAAFFGVKS